MKQILNEGNNKGNQQGGELNEGQKKGNNKVVNTPKPVIEPAPWKPMKKYIVSSINSELNMAINVKLINDIIEVRGSDGILLMKLDNKNAGLYIYFKSRIEQYGC